MKNVLTSVILKIENPKKYFKFEKNCFFDI